MTDTLASRKPALFCMALFAACLALALGDLGLRLPSALWGQALWQPDLGDLRQVLAHYSWLPRLCMTLLCGASLALAGLLMQQVLRNPLASPTTLGVAGGAQLALTLATLFAPQLLLAREWLAMGGGALASLLVFALAWRRAMSPLALILAGLVVSLYLSALNIALMMLQPQGLTALFIWGAGSLSQHNWDAVLFLAPRLALALALLPLLLRPLSLLDLQDSGARSLGVSLPGLRLAGLGLGVFLTACVVSSVGVIGFIGLAAPAIARLLGARTLGQRLLWSPLLGAALLWLTDLLVQWIAGPFRELLPTGAVAGLLGAPLLLWLIPRLRLADHPAPSGMAMPVGRRAERGLVPLVALLGLALLLALALGQGPDGWRWHLAESLLELRAPRVIAAAAAGLMLALAGTLIQRLTGNPMASPELMGISAGAALGLLAAVFLLPAAGFLPRLALGALGATLTLLALLWLGRRSGFAPQRLLLAGIALSALFDAVQVLVLALGDPRGQQLLAWLSGSTYFVDASMAAWALGLALLLLLLCLPATRWLELLPLGAGTAGSLGVPLARSRLLLLGLAALLSAAATLVLGPLSFVGLMAPHLARLLGFGRARSQLLAGALLGALVMVLADWLGRNLLFPAQLPAGLLAALLGGAYLMWGLSRR
ncbi:Fe(3+)-hydroxamate ABC transporter permease FhuB [Pseudomonas sp. MBLB4123]|uniref:Fe(3+)-hydroxamate ABC transporter permease FhuB n=1 Tax=Pseudomonas benzenivorans TaxID=556533 RepID=A0ABZ0Q165_9PSED|nr:Fe(3+)-hydroxamate ABC transporter permease FhuB [Pseudomonas benzenivorans]WPC06502.1 Fe(3+)-hydroxamate ABC transporter permease FhuB [Pseudomonas benzenivorans]